MKTNLFLKNEDSDDQGKEREISGKGKIFQRKTHRRMDTGERCLRPNIILNKTMFTSR